MNKEIITTDKNIDLLFKEWVRKKGFDEQCPTNNWTLPIISSAFKQYIKYEKIKLIKNKKEGLKLIQDFYVTGFSQLGITVR